jgi:hypothetical protein
LTIDHSDAWQVANLVTQYNRSFDGDDIESWLATFTPDGQFVSRSEGAIVGHEAMREWFAAHEHNTIHVTTDPTLEQDGDVVRHRCTIMVFRKMKEGVVLGSVGEYADEVLRTDAGWRFVSRAPTTQPVVPRPTT